MKQHFLQNCTVSIAWCFLSAGLLSAQDAPPAAPAQDEKEILDSIRFLDRPDGKSELQTAIVSFKSPEDAQVDLVSVVHIGDATYFDAMNQILSTYDVVLYEMVGGPMETRGEREANNELQLTRLLQRVVQSMLGLGYQLDKIDYDKPNFVHADADWEQWETLMKERNQSMMTLFTRAMQMQNDPEMKKHIEEMGSEEMMSELLSALTNFNPDRFKRTLAPMLSESEEFITKLEGEDGTVLISERNKIVMEVLQQELDKGHKKIAVFYGAGHMPDFKDRLEKRGFEEVGTDWVAAWNIGAEGATASGLDAIENLLKDDQVIEGVMSFFRSFSGK